MYRIIFRSCDKVQSLHNAPRPLGLDKRATIKLCFKSLLRAVEGYEHTIHVIADDISDDLRNFFRSHNVTMTEGVFGNDESIRVSLRLAMSYDENNWVYFCEDDYLHKPEMFLWTDDLIRNREAILLTKSRRGLNRFIPGDHRRSLHHLPLFIHPPDYPNRYKPRERYRSYIFISQYCHWRQVSNTTFSFMAEVKSLERFRDVLEHSATGADDGYLSKNIYAVDGYKSRALCLSPIPGLSTHMHDEAMTPLVDWKKIAEDIGVI